MAIRSQSIHADKQECQHPRRGLETVGLIAGCLLTLFFAFQVFCFVQDDAFITYRYAWHLRHGYGPVFNSGEHTEGYSCPLYMYLTGLLMFLPGDVLFRAKLLGVVCALGTLWLAWRLARELALPVGACAAVPVLLGANASFALSAVDGMETTLQALLVTLAVLLFVREQRSGQGWLSAGVLLAVALNRAEGAIYFVAALLPFCLGIRNRGLLRRDRLWLAAFILPFTLFLLWRHSYYGDWVPNTVYAKSMPLEAALDYAMGPAYVLRTVFLHLNGRVVPLVISIVLWLIAVTGAISAPLRRNGALLLALGVAAQTLVALRAGGDWMDGWRYMMAVTPLWTVLIAAGLQEIATTSVAAGKQQIERGVYCIASAMLTLVFLAAGAEYRSVETTPVSWAAMGWTTDTRVMLRQYHMSAVNPIVDNLRRLLPAGSTVAYSEMGAIPYFTPGVRWLDTYGLTDREVAHLPGTAHSRTGASQSLGDSESELGRLLLRRRPTYIVHAYEADKPQSAILNGAYQPLTRFSLHQLINNKPTDMVVWSYRPDLQIRRHRPTSDSQPNH
jgi:hypothetical protein